MDFLRGVGESEVSIQPLTGFQGSGDADIAPHQGGDEVDLPVQELMEHLRRASESTVRFTRAVLDPEDAPVQEEREESTVRQIDAVGRDHLADLRRDPVGLGSRGKDQGFMSVHG
jgi:hypothetical protein